MDGGSQIHHEHAPMRAAAGGVAAAGQLSCAACGLLQAMRETRVEDATLNMQASNGLGGPTLRTRPRVLGVRVPRRPFACLLVRHAP